MIKKSKYLHKLIVVFILVIGILTGCSDSEEAAQKAEVEEEQQQDAPNIEIDTSEVQINGDGLELIDVKIEDNNGLYNVVASVKNNSENKYNLVRVYMKLYDETGAVLDNRSDTGSQLEPGEVWKTQIFIADTKGVAKIKITEVAVIGAASNNNTNTAGSSQNTFEDTVIKCAQTLVYKNIQTPGSAEWVSAEVLGQDEYGRYLVDIVVDAQNGFGALIRSGFIVVLQSVQQDGRFTHSPMFFMKEYSKDFERDQAIENMKSINDWNEDPNQPEEDSTEPTS